MGKKRIINTIVISKEYVRFHHIVNKIGSNILILPAEKYLKIMNYPIKKMDKDLMQRNSRVKIGQDQLYTYKH